MKVSIETQEDVPLKYPCILVNKDGSGYALALSDRLGVSVDRFNSYINFTDNTGALWEKAGWKPAPAGTTLKFTQ